jgi:hypothetical protein
VSTSENNNNTLNSGSITPMLITIRTIKIIINTAAAAAVVVVVVVVAAAAE